MSNVSFNRVVDVNVTVNDRFATVANFSTPLILENPQDGFAKLTEANPVITYSNLSEMLLDGWLETDVTYLTAQAMLATKYAPRTFKVGSSTGAHGADVAAIAAVDNNFYVVVPARLQEITDVADLLALNETLTVLGKIFFFDTHDDLTLSSATDANSIGNVLQAIQPARMAGFHIDKERLHADPADDFIEVHRQFYAAKSAAFVSGVNYNNPGSHYTLKFVELTGALPAKVTDAQAQAITGFLPGTGQNPEAGAHLNTYVCTGGLNFVVEGTMVDGTFIDLVTFSDWLQASLQSSILSVFTNNRVVPYDTTGISLIYGAIAGVMGTAVASGALTANRVGEDGEFLPAFEIAVQDVSDVLPALQAKRISPVFEYCLRYAGATHFVEVTGAVKVAE